MRLPVKSMTAKVILGTMLKKKTLLEMTSLLKLAKKRRILRTKLVRS